MRHSNLLFFPGPFIVLALAYVCDWIAIRTYNKFADASAMQRVSANPLTSEGALARVRKNIPPGPLRTRIIGLQVASLGATLAFATLLTLSIKYK